MTYSDTIQYLFESQPAFHLVGAKAYKPGFENTNALMEHLGNPHKQFKSVHIAGTNGKGSTSHLIAASLQAAGYKVGLYTSPHLVDFRERIRINGTMIPEQEVIDYVAENKAFLDELKPSFFESTMGMAFEYFAKEKVDVAVIEVGLGGRLDSTNIITPLLSVITNIGMDHTEFLGDTLPKIALEKAGIIKHNVPVVIGETDPETAPVFITKAQDEHSSFAFADQLPAHKLDCQLVGLYQSKNKQTAFVALDLLQKLYFPKLSEEAIARGFANVCTLTGLHGRWEILAKEPLTICDTGHNSHGLKYVAQQLQSYIELGKNLHIVFGMVDDKDVDVVMQLLPKQATYYFTQAQTHRAIPATQMQQKGADCGLMGTSFDAVAAAILAAQTAATPNDVIFIGGSNYVVGEALSSFSRVAISH